MYILYNIALYLGFLILTPRFLYDAVTKGKYAAGFGQRLGSVPEIEAGGRTVVLLHCVSVGETNAALPLAVRLKESFPNTALVVSTTTKTGQAVARQAYADIADQIVYFPFDFAWAVKRFLRRVRPSVVLLTETELWFNFIRLAHQDGAKVVIVNGRLSERSFRRYSLVKRFMKRLLANVDAALMQGSADAGRLTSLGAHSVEVTGNLKFDTNEAPDLAILTTELACRFGLASERPVILAASTHSPEEKLIVEAFKNLRMTVTPGRTPRLMIVPRHPERFNEVAEIIRGTKCSLARRSDAPSDKDKTADVILLDSIGELKAVYPLAEIVFVGGSLIPHGGQSIFEPASAGRAIVTGPYTANFDAAVKEFLSKNALIQLTDTRIEDLALAFEDLLDDADRRNSLGKNALAVMVTNRGAADRTVEYLTPFFTPHE